MMSFDPATRECRFAYVDFATPDGKKVAVAMSEQTLLGRRLLIKEGQSPLSRPARGVRSSEGAQGKTSRADRHLQARLQGCPSLPAKH
jgi:hypothetical protein